jgi:hypothetical protein
MTDGIKRRNLGLVTTPIIPAHNHAMEEPSTPSLADAMFAAASPLTEHADADNVASPDAEFEHFHSPARSASVSRRDSFESYTGFSDDEAEDTGFRSRRMSTASMTDSLKDFPVCLVNFDAMDSGQLDTIAQQDSPALPKKASQIRFETLQEESGGDGMYATMPRHQSGKTSGGDANGADGGGEEVVTGFGAVINSAGDSVATKVTVPSTPELRSQPLRPASTSPNTTPSKTKASGFSVGRGRGVRCAVSTEMYTRGVSLSFSLLLLRLKRCHACDQWHYPRVLTPLSGWHGKLRPHTEGRPAVR